MRTRVIPALLLEEGRLVKTTRFATPSYVGDPMNAMRIFNDKEADELIVLDIAATPRRRKPDFGAVRGIVEEAFMPIGYGGGIRDPDDAARLFDIGVEKVVIGTAAIDDPALITAIASRYGSQAIIVAIDVKSHMFGRAEVMVGGGRKPTGRNPVAVARAVSDAGAGEILLTSIDRDGTRRGYDVDLIGKVASAVSVAVVACGGAGKVEDFRDAVDAGASAVAAGSLFVQYGPHRAVLISYPDRALLERTLP